MQIVERKISELKPAEYNPRKKSAHVIDSIKGSLKDYGWLAPVVVNKNPARLDVIVGGHRRLEAAIENGETTVPTIEVNLSLENEKKANLRLNAQEQFDKKGLAGIIADLHAIDAESTKSLGFNEKEVADLLYQARYNKGSSTGVLADKFLVPPFSVLDAKSERWMQRKKQWLELVGDLSETRVGTLSGDRRNVLMMYGGGTSQFDPCIAELMYLWFSPEKGVILDPFGGEQTKAVVAGTLGFDYHGVEIRPDQVETNRAALDRLGLKGTFYCGDSTKLDELVPADLQADLIFTSPPYYDLEIYSEGKEDLSAKPTYEQFMAGYRTIFEKAIKHLKPNRFVVLKLGDVRDERGMYRNFIGDNIAMFKSLGFELYNELIYLQMLATAPHRAERNMRKRKVVKTHQNILTLYKGDPEALRNPRLLEIHEKVLTFYAGDPEAIQTDFKNPPPIERDVFAALEAPPENEHANDTPES